MSFIVQCLCVCPAAPPPHLPSLLITAHYREVKQISQKALSQSLSHPRVHLQAPPQPAQRQACRRIRRLKDTTQPGRQKQLSQCLSFRSPFPRAPSLPGPGHLSPNTSSVTSPWVSVHPSRATEPSPLPCRVWIHPIAPGSWHLLHPPSLGC